MKLDVPHYQTFGFVVLRGIFDPRALAAELDRAMREGLVSSSYPFEAPGGGKIRFRYVPMMSARTPVSLSLLDLLAPVAATLLGGPVLPTRAKGVLYRGDTPWHADSAFVVPSVGFVAYLEHLRAENGALRVLPGSQHGDFADALRALGASDRAAEALPGHVVATEPGDVIAFDEHLYHASSGGGDRRQWRLDYLRDPGDDESEERVRSYFRSIYPPDWDGGYDVERYPSYGPDWQFSQRPSVARLRELGVYELATRQEAHAKSRR
jgi:hypothetical protein